MVTATTTARATTSSTRAGFNRGYIVFQMEEIAGGRRLHDAAILVHGTAKVRRMLRAAPASVFRSLRYGRRWIDDEHGNPDAVCLMIGGERYLDGKAGADNIVVPGRRGWREFAERTRQLSLLPRWADGLTASAEALDGMGYAVAESIAAMLAFKIESDDEVVATVLRTRRRR
jgi:hypothetical protein